MTAHRDEHGLTVAGLLVWVTVLAGLGAGGLWVASRGGSSPTRKPSTAAGATATIPTSVPPVSAGAPGPTASSQALPPNPTASSRTAGPAPAPPSATPAQPAATAPPATSPPATAPAATSPPTTRQTPTTVKKTCSVTVVPSEQRGSRQTGTVTDSFGVSVFGWRISPVGSAQKIVGGGQTYGSGSGTFAYTVPTDQPSGTTYGVLVWFEDSTGAHVAECSASFTTS